MEEAVAQFYENPNKYSRGPVQSTNAVTTDSEKGSIDSPLYSPPPYVLTSNRRNVTRHQIHTNAVIEAANLRARDEVCSPMSSLSVHR